MSNRDVINALAESWASIDGKLDAYDRERDMRLSDHMRNLEFTGAYEGYQCEAEEMMRRLERRGFEIVPIKDWNDMADAPETGEFLAERQTTGDWLVVVRHDLTPTSVVNPATGLLWSPKRWRPLPSAS